MQNILDYQVREKLTEKKNAIIYSGWHEAEKKDVIITVLNVSAPSVSEIARFRQEYDRIKNIGSDGIVRVYDVRKYDNGFAIIQEYFDSMSLSEEILKTNTFDVKWFLK